MSADQPVTVVEPTPIESLPDGPEPIYVGQTSANLDTGPVELPTPQPSPLSQPVTEQMPSVAPELDRLDPVAGPVTLSSGVEVDIMPLKARQFFKLLRIITRGGATMLPQMGLSMNMEDGAFAANLIGLVVFSIPEAEDEAVDFVRSMVDVKNAQLMEKKFREERRIQLWQELENPELDDLITIVEAVVLREADDLKSLGKRLQKMFALAQRTGQVDGIPTPSASTT